MNWNPTLRRHFLQGAGKSALVLPFLPSLLSRRAEAQAATAPRQKSFIGISMWNHVAMQFNAGEAEAKTTPSVYLPSFLNMTPTPIAGKHTIHAKTLADALKDNPRGMISEIIDASFNPYLPKMNMLNGLDYLFKWSHHSGMFGNGHATADTDVAAKNPDIAPIDQVMAFSPNFHKNSALHGQFLHWTGFWGDAGTCCNYYANTFTYQNPAQQATSPVIKTTAIEKPAVVWDKYFAKFMPPPAGAPTVDRRKTLVDAVIGDYKAVLGGPRLGGDDRQRIERHVQLLQDTQKAVTATVAMCNKPARPSASGIKQTLQVFNDVIVSLIACGMCHSFNSRILSFVEEYDGAWHQFSHGEKGGTPVVKQQMIGIARDVALDLAKKLDAQGLLDDSLIAMISEHGRIGHIAVGASAVTLGGAGGAFKTGQYIDYRNMNSGDDLDGGNERSGFPMNQLWANMLMAMDVPPSEFEPLNKTSYSLFTPGNSGYGSNIPRDAGSGFASAFKGHNMSTWLPLLRA